MACRLRHRDCIKQAQQRYHEWTAKKKRPPPELLGVVLDEGVRQGGAAAWERAYTAYMEAKSPTEKYQLIGAMASTTQPPLISRLLRLSIEGSSFRPNIIPRLLSDLTKNEAARALTWRFFRVHYKQYVRIWSGYYFSQIRGLAMGQRLAPTLAIAFMAKIETPVLQRLGDGSSLLINSIRAMVDKFSTQEDLDEVKAFLADKGLEYNMAKLNQMFEQIELNIQWRRLNEQPLREWLEVWDEKRRVIQRRRRRSHHHHHRHHHGHSHLRS
ncbi:unnamed protein product [Heligmosomoides polygyrus]|uniref:ERAP1_C domain-containing protein n=1 Tax=Heligmosomoides polygyrus TaxID=6339 RepID=A0A3P8BW93_HELPZ|nr:unnamed protein product [Heligmosomoides polygyrus]